MERLFKNPTKKTKKMFNSLPDEERTEIINGILNEKISKITAKQIADSIIAGMELAQENIYNDFVLSIDDVMVGTREWQEEAEKLLSYLRIKHLDYVKKQREREVQQNGND